MAHRDAAPAWAALVISDLHLNRGPVLSNGKPNTLEDFRADHAFAKMFEAFARRYAGDTKLTLVLNGDTVDFMAIPFQGRYRGEPKLEGALDKFQQAFDGHPVFFGALADFLKDDGAELVVMIGNHDQDFAWPELQVRFKELLAGLGADPSRIRFAREIEWPDGVLVVHGAEFDAWARLPSESEMFITDKVADWKFYLAIALALAAFLHGVRPISELAFGWKDWTPRNVAMAALAFIPWMLMINWAWSKIYFRWFATDQRIMNYPYSYYMNAGLATLVKRHFLPWIGRMRDHGPIWALTLARNWHYALAIVPMLLIHLLYYMAFVRMLSVRFKASLRAAVGILGATTHADHFAEEAAKFLKSRPKVRRVIFGHTHGAGVQTLPMGEYDAAFFNTGTGGEQITMVKPEGAFFRRVVFHWRHAPRAAAFFTAVHLSAYVACQAFANAVGWSDGAWNPRLAFLVGALLLVRQAYALHRDRNFTEITPCEIRGYQKDDVEVELYRFEAGGFVPYLDPK